MTTHSKDAYIWHCEIEKCISNAIGSCYPREWNEDHISYTWLKELRNKFPQMRVPGRSSFQVNWDAFKADGKLEESHGDIAFLVKISFKNNKTLEGVAFMEAKRIYEKGSYDALKWPQLVSQSLGLSNHRLILYDYQYSQPVGFTTHHTYELVDLFYRECFPQRTKAHSITTQHALAMKVRSRQLHEIAYPLSSQIFLRYFQGQDLDYSSDIVNAVKVGAIGGIKFLVVAHVSLNSDQETSDESVINILGKDHIYKPLDTDERRDE